MTDTNTPRGRDELITSPANPTVKLARSLHRKRVRHRERAILVEGVRALSTAADLGVRIRVLCLDVSRTDDIPADLLARLRAVAGRVVLLDAPLFQQVADTEHPQPVLAICDMPDQQLPVDCSFVLALDAVRDPGNLGTLIRSAAAAGADGVALLPGCADPHNPKVVRSSAGSLFAVPVQQFANLDHLVTTGFLERPQIGFADADGDFTYDAIDWRLPTVLVIGGEASGISQEVRTYADFAVSIPIDPKVESLNAGVAGSILAFEISRQRRLHD